ncbi:condensation domain-containing protein [Sinomicrobium oceani]|uniref:condensation domain-containing protein n=1 Tax=Sinomicrobium oceani TaxID=1150368 RepID=UPI00227C0D9E|nr:condensation domain-containing protein [Sinomicrobium oceani]
MKEDKLMETLNLLKKLNSEGFKISYEMKNLSLKFPKGKEINEDLINELKANKDSLILYFENYAGKIKLTDTKEKEKKIKKIPFEGEDYYEITPVQKYWVDDTIDYKYKQQNRKHGTVVITYEVFGPLLIKAFNNAVSYIVNRHESLRTTFHEINANYYMRINKYNKAYIPEYWDFQSKPKNDAQIKKIIEFDNHNFDLKKGPLFLARLLKIKEKHFEFSLKIHHVIFDTVSDGILKRDLFTAYKAFSQNKIPNLPALKFQYKDNLASINNYIKNNYNHHKDYWDKLYRGLPEPLQIPIDSIDNQIEHSFGEKEMIEFPKRLINRLSLIAKKNTVSLFVILQATFKAYLCYKTGQSDILIGTYIFGRDHSNTENQIGCYAKTVLIRTIFNRKDSFREIVKKVAKSNEDMKNYWAFSLMEKTKEMLSHDESLIKSFWKINLQYYDLLQKKSLISDSLGSDLKFLIKRNQDKSIIGFIMQLTFIRSAEQLWLQIEYDSSQYDSLTIKNLISDYVNFANEHCRIN